MRKVEIDYFTLVILIALALVFIFCIIRTIVSCFGCMCCICTNSGRVGKSVLRCLKCWPKHSVVRSDGSKVLIEHVWIENYQGSWSRPQIASISRENPQSASGNNTETTTMTAPSVSWCFVLASVKYIMPSVIVTPNMIPANVSKSFLGLMQLTALLLCVGC